MKNRDEIKALLERVKEMGVDFGWLPTGIRTSSVSIEHIVEGLFSNSKFPLETTFLDISDSEYEQYLASFREAEGGLRCQAKNSKGRQCKLYVEETWGPLEYKKFGYCKYHRPTPKLVSSL